MNSRLRTETGELDWREIRHRLDEAASAMEKSLQLSAKQAKAIMDQRAQALAQVPAPAPSAAEVLTVAVFDLSNERYAIETHYVRRVVPMREYTLVPGAPAFLVGVINLRGDILAVVDFRKFLGVAQPGLTDHARVVVLGDEQDEFGILADAVHEVATLRIDQVMEAPASVTAGGREYLRGVTPEAMTVLDGAALLRDARLFIDQSEVPGG